MTDDRLPDRLASWFNDEVIRAERDLARRPLRGRIRRRSLGTSPALVALAVFVAIGAVAIGQQNRPVATASPSTSLAPSGFAGQSASPSPTTSIQTIGAWYADGIPKEIDGEDVIRAGAATSTTEAGSEDSSFLVGGWVASAGLTGSCAIEPLPSEILVPSFSPCRRWTLGENAGTAVDAFETTAELPAGLVVIRAHPADVRGNMCQTLRVQCLRELIVEAIVWAGSSRYADGFPDTIDGQPVHRLAGLEETTAQAARASFLLGAWAGHGVVFPCPVEVIGGPTPHPLLPACPWNPLWDEPSAVGKFTGVVTEARLPRGPVILRVHVGDAQAETCPAIGRTMCREAIVVEAVVWSGDEVTATAPYTIQDVVEQLGFALTSGNPLPVRPLLGDTPAGSAGVALPDCDPGVPPGSWASTDPAIGRILVFPSAAARQVAEPNFESTGLHGLDRDGKPCNIRAFDGGTFQWLGHGNVLVEVSTGADGGGEGTANVERVRAALDRLGG